jgi:hypothetical protein
MFGQPPQAISSDANHRFVIKHADGTPMYNLLHLAAPFKDRGQPATSLVTLPPPNQSTGGLQSALCFGNGGATVETPDHYRSADFKVNRTSSPYVFLSDVGEFGERILDTDTGGPCFPGDDSFQLIGLLSSNSIQLLGPNVPAIQQIMSSHS